MVKVSKKLYYYISGPGNLLMSKGTELDIIKDDAFLKVHYGIFRKLNDSLWAVMTAYICHKMRDKEW